MAAHSALTIRLVGGHPVLDLLNTVDPGREGEDRDVLRNFRADVSWATRVGLISTADGDRLLDLGERLPSEAHNAHTDLLAVRETLRAIVQAEAEVTVAAPAAVEHFEQSVVAAAVYRRFRVAPDQAGWYWADNDLETIQHRVAVAAADLLADRSRRRISVCAAPNCGWYFLDASKSGNRRWCSDASCGAASRVRRLRQRRSVSR